MSLSNVGSSLTGLIKAHPGLQLLVDRNCVVRADNVAADGKVKLISGGGSGHEPAHAGYVGRGMLTAAVCGDIYSSPSVTAILDCLRSVASFKDSVIFIVKNYTGDRLSFGMALERAQAAMGFENLRMLLVGEDCAIEDSNIRKSVGKRGLAGVVLVHKLLGAMAEIGCDIEEIYHFGERLIQGNFVATIGFTFDLKDDTLENIEIGKGIHGEPGVYTMKACKDFSSIIDFAIAKLTNRVSKAADVVLLINNLGGTSEFLMGIFVNSLVEKIKPVYSVRRIYCGTFLSSLNQAGISVTVLNLGYSQKILEYLDFAVNTPSTLFGKSNTAYLPISTTIHIGIPEPLVPLNISNMYTISEELGVKLASTILNFVCEALVSCTNMLNIIDREAGDGDTGTTIGKGSGAILEQLNAGKLDLAHPRHLLQQISIILQQDMGGSSGALYSLFFQGASTVFTYPAEGNQTVSIAHWSRALCAGIDTIVKYALTEIGDRTMLDALKEGEQRLASSVSQGLPVLDCVESFTKGCEEAARKTQQMVAKAGRASYAASSATPIVYKYPDPGAHAVSIWARALFEACKQVLV
ncbi:PTS-dependent dihydroxyacetone kinase 1, dihydroxyacetone-binding subunit DhaK-like [Topomyia yanbarensis]|uniref:PTS-dependent dihydroxyacetone kinase 1, dihydroxyacetone-binding subunit DhaK-like n=1 Tax=Topomyia yanbarensis TaxID=2498891 RepID=UPI00273B43B8|nr:PTS-dependent dihydroxyacetone kinase 1, dihydroxyacetone-binding subunit DhaK-like [Topomyia yanbarensis]XP_058818958.1 PTS-dependent dihydroxyacetone kinase 1, dihydroxyacetone-binding subunit DhaK-like [Topomyia yanbarensis]XP_058818959.1 PTS-dependent dihydroxyacetone kinase 1, dihydroxyacetone-binding subunit DhaK-like [Topomyia yanbarensis]